MTTEQSQRIEPGTKVRIHWKTSSFDGSTGTVKAIEGKSAIIDIDSEFQAYFPLSSLEIIEEPEPLKSGQDVWVKAKVSNAIKPARNGYADIIVNDYYYAADGDDPEDAELIRVPISALRRAE